MAKTFATSGAQVAQRLIGEGPRITSRAKQGLNLEAEKVATRSKQEFAPVDKGRLRNSIHVINAKVIGDNLVAFVVAGGPGINYAVAIHEHPSEHSPRTWGDVVNFKRGGTKYLERPLNEQLVGMRERLALFINAR